MVADSSEDRFPFVEVVFNILKKKTGVRFKNEGIILQTKQTLQHGQVIRINVHGMVM